MKPTAGNCVPPASVDRAFLAICLVALAGLPACSGSDGGTAAVSTSPSPPIDFPTAPPPAPPPQTVGDVQFTFDNSVSAAAEIPPGGGQLVLDVPGGATFSLDFPRGAFFAATTAVLAQSIVNTQGLPQGLTPIAVAAFGPAGLEFGVQPTIEIDLRNLGRSAGNVFVFLANDDGTGFTYLLPQDGDMIAATLSDGPYRAAVPHFSGIGVAVSDPNGPGVAEVDVAATGEQRARQELSRRIDSEAQSVSMGQRVIGEPLADVDSIIAAWTDDLGQRVIALDEQSSFEAMVTIIKEFLRLQETRRALGQIVGIVSLEDTELGADLIAALATQIHVWNDRCIAGNANAPKQINDRVSLLRNLASVELLGETTLMRIVSPNFCIDTGF